jgi:hypothetical protein
VVQLYPRALGSLSSPLTTRSATEEALIPVSAQLNSTIYICHVYIISCIIYISYIVYILYIYIHIHIIYIYVHIYSSYMYTQRVSKGALQL